MTPPINMNVLKNKLQTNGDQLLAIAAATVTVAVMLYIRPYWIGEVTAYIRTLDLDNQGLPYNRLLYWELSFVGITLLSALIALRTGGNRAQRISFLFGLLTETVWFAYSATTQSHLFLAKEVMWWSLTMFAVLLLALLIGIGLAVKWIARRPDEVIYPP